MNEYLGNAEISGYKNEWVLRKCKNLCIKMNEYLGNAEISGYKMNEYIVNEEISG